MRGAIRKTAKNLGSKQSGLALLGPMRPDPHKGPYNADAFHVDIQERRAVYPPGHLSTNVNIQSGGTSLKMLFKHHAVYMLKKSWATVTQKTHFSI